MTHPARQLTELVRLLQERGYIFAADPEPIGEALRHAGGSAEEKLNRRAEMIDSDRKLQDALNRVRQTSGWLLFAATAFCLLSGFVATAGLMQQSGLNFFFVFAGALGLHTLMLLLWLVWTLAGKKAGGLLVNPALWIRGKDPLNQALVRLYSEVWEQPAMRWQIGQTAHRLWLATLVGMLAAVVLLLMVRQYTFNWETTLLTDGAFVNIVAALAWLPQKLGFPVPDAAAVLNSRLNADAATARQWGGLLIGSILCYGLLPRFAAWLVCTLLARRTAAPLPLEKPYYQQIIRQWQTRVVDADRQRETVAAVAPKIRFDDKLPKWAAMLEGEWPDADWHQHILGQQWLDKGTADSRDAVAALKEELSRTPAQLLIGIRARQVPDRGVLRQISALAEAAAGGAVVQLLADKNVSETSFPHDAGGNGLDDYLKQWHTALNERGIAWLNPPRISQAQRLQQQEAV
ncbi:MAG: DUF2868 domain-containing protein [Neisseria sp.]|nr:DUF2868 domain-containing protein [Neisseria sp.]